MTVVADWGEGALRDQHGEQASVKTFRPAGSRCSPSSPVARKMNGTLVSLIVSPLNLACAGICWGHVLLGAPGDKDLPCLKT